ncbi:MAG: hypothetical protein ABSG42_06885 [Nitrospirota bacterium]
MQASFSAGAGVTPLVFSVNPRYPGKVTIMSGNARVETEGGEEYIYKKGPGSVVLELKFENMPSADFDGGFDYTTGSQASGTQSLVNWFINLSNAPFSYNDPFGNGYTVTFAVDKIEFQLTDKGLYEGVIALREETGI